MYTRACSLIMKYGFIEQNCINEIINKQVKKEIIKIVEKNLDQTIGKCLNGAGCQYKDSCVLQTNKNIQKLVRREIKKLGTINDDS